MVWEVCIVFMFTVSKFSKKIWYEIRENLGECVRRRKW